MMTHKEMLGIVATEALEAMKTDEQTIEQFAEEQSKTRFYTEMEKAITLIKSMLDEAKQEKLSLDYQMAENQKLPTPEERHSGGFSAIYASRTKCESRIQNLTEALSSLRKVI